MVLEFWREVDTVVFADVADGLRGKLLGFVRDTHRIEDVTTGCEVTSESTGRDIGKFCQSALRYKAIFIVEINHKTE